MTYIVALTGGIGSGKTIISNSFKKKGVFVIDTDVIAKKIIEKNQELSNKIKKKFGKKILNKDLSINRFLLKKYIFSKKNNKLWLENILHPKILQESKKKIKSTKYNWCLWVVPLLFEKHLEIIADRVLLIDTTIKTQIQRVVQRDKITKKEAKKIISYQTSRKKRIYLSDDIIFNKNKKISQLNIYTNYLYHFYTYLFRKKKINIKKNYLTKFY